MRFLLFIFALAMISCSSEVKIQFPSEFVTANEVILNGELNLKDFVQEGGYSEVNVNRGSVEVSINGETQTFSTRKGGLLNLNQEEFVVFPVVYGEDEAYRLSQASSIQPHSVLIDSVIFFKPNRMNMGEEFYVKYHQNPDFNIRGHKIPNIITLLEHTQFFVEKDWDINVNEEIPDQIEVRVNKNSYGSSVESREVILPAALFQVFALLSGEYKSVDLREDLAVE